MPQTMSQPAVTRQDNSLVNVHPQMAKADLHDNAVPESLSPVVKEAAKRSYGKQGAAAAQLGKDEGNFARDVAAERLTLRDLKCLGRQFLAELGKELVNEYAPLDTPKARATRKIREAHAALDELSQALEQLA